MDLDKAIKTRRSVRFFTEKKVSHDKIIKIIEAANYAPSATDKQAWRFIIIDEKEKLSRLSNEGGAYFVEKAPLAMLILYEKNTDNIEYQDHIQSASAAIQNMQLKITALGLGSCWVANLPSKKTVRKIFNILNNYDPIALVVIGYPKNKPTTIPRKHTVDDIISYNIFQLKEKQNSYFPYKIKIKRIFRKVYFSLPFIIKKNLLPIARKFEKREF